MTRRRAGGWCLAAAVIGVLMASPAAARDAAFLEPGTGGGGVGASDEAVRVEPKSEIDLGETTINSARRATLFFVNESAAAVHVEKVEVNSDADVIAEIANDDCTKQGTIAPQSRCSIEVSVTPSSPGTWGVDVLMTYNGAGRIARGKLTGKTSGTASTGEKKETGLAMNSKEPSPVAFGNVDVGAKAVRSALMVNDSADSITLYSIDVIEASNGLQLLDQGCTVDMELKPGESCPVTMIWAPTDPGDVSTDLIIRHSGRQGFVVVPIRGTAKGEATESEKTTKDSKPSASTGKSTTPPTPAELEKATSGKIAPVEATALVAKSATPAAPTAPRLIGTVGNRAVLLMTDGTTKIASSGDDVDLGDDQTAKLLTVSAKSVELLIDGKKKELKLGSSPELIAKASVSEQARSDKDNKDKDKDKKSSSGSSTKTETSSSSTTSSSSSSAAPASSTVMPAMPAAPGGKTPTSSGTTQ